MITLHHEYVNSVLADETHTSGNNEATKKPSQEMDGCEYHLYYFLMIRLTNLTTDYSSIYGTVMFQEKFKFHN